MTFVRLSRTRRSWPTSRWPGASLRAPTAAHEPAELHQRLRERTASTDCSTPTPTLHTCRRCRVCATAEPVSPTPNRSSASPVLAPSTRASGRHGGVTFRWSSDKKLRAAICDFAGDRWRGNQWGAHRYRELRAAGTSHPHAERILARTWTHIIWRCWEDHASYDPDRHPLVSGMRIARFEDDHWRFGRPSRRRGPRCLDRPRPSAATADPLRLDGQTCVHRERCWRARRTTVFGCAWRLSHHDGSPSSKPFIASVTRFGPSSM